jgi:hypothetical protein
MEFFGFKTMTIMGANLGIYIEFMNLTILEFNLVSHKYHIMFVFCYL